MPGPEDKTTDVWKDHDVNPTRCGSCGSDKIGLVGDFFQCIACGHQWAKRVERGVQYSAEQRLALHDGMLKVLLAHTTLSMQDMTDEEMESVAAFNEYMRNTQP